MSYFDIGLLVILAGFIGNGLAKGLIRLLGQVVGLIIASYVASHFYLVFYDWAKNWTGFSMGTEKFLSFVILFVVVAGVVSVAFILIEKIFDLISIIPFTKLINRLLGGILGFIEGALALGLILFVAARYAWIGSLMGGQLVSSHVAPWLIKVATIIMPFLPEALKTLKSIIG
ncbi:MAG: CvpA family protein [Candidatus Falkowbacteria bacterium]